MVIVNNRLMPYRSSLDLALARGCPLVLGLGTIATLAAIPSSLAGSYLVDGVLGVSAAIFCCRSIVRPSPLRILRILVTAVFVLGYYAQAWWMLFDSGVVSALVSADVVPSAITMAADPATIVASLDCAARTFFVSALVVTFLDRLVADYTHDDTFI